MRDALRVKAERLAARLEKKERAKKRTDAQLAEAAQFAADMRSANYCYQRLTGTLPTAELASYALVHVDSRYRGEVRRVPNSQPPGCLLVNVSPSSDDDDRAGLWDRVANKLWSLGRLMDWTPKQSRRIGPASARHFGRRVFRPRRSRARGPAG